jgi:predicted kinase
MHSPRYINPDHYLQTESGRVFTPERNEVAWERAYADLELGLRHAALGTKLYIVVGVQGAGKTTWIKSNTNSCGADALFLDAALPARKHRARALALAAAFGVPAVAVWVNTPLQLALARNRERAEDERVPDGAAKNVFSMLEPPSLEEGFSQVIEVTTSETRR